ncbi:MAG TPA: orotate phosphoribosyltransferase [Methanomicrobiales archaeon]|nr:orotate phosphoribosyltransferase [Methanomicrobiales archaeon]
MVKSMARLLKERGAVQYGDFILSSGEKSRYYIDIKSAITDASLLRRIGEEIAASYTFDVVAGVAVGGIPIAVAAALASGKPYVIIRREAKSHGKPDLIIGTVAGKDLLLVEDVTTSGGSALYGAKAIRDAGGKIDSVVTVVDREQGAEETLLREGIHLHSLVRARDLLE